MHESQVCACWISFPFWKTSQELGLLFYSTWEVFQRGSAKSVHLNSEKQGEGERELAIRHF
jgi:hypothetical protein